ncbi:MAG: imidazolonepropionase [Planctomycetota bacterium]|nr:MAG: imidazolonepropionase [Planctomycetota bacterium]
MSRLLLRSCRVVPGPAGEAPIPCADVLVEGGVVARIAPRPSPDAPSPLAPDKADVVVEARGRALLPAFVDAHTHACWAGQRLDEWEAKLAASRTGDDDDAAYLRTLKAGGGILATVRAVRAASQRQLADNLRARLDVMLHEGTCAVEVKSGYGLSTEHELKMLRAIADAAADFPGAVVPTALLGHAVDPDEPDFFRTTIEQTLPAVHAEFPDICVDAYCEEGAWPVEACEALFRRALELGHPVRVHADQFHALGMTQRAIELGALSVDHLEATPPATLGALAASSTFGVMLPACGFHLDDRYADGRSFLDTGGDLVVATNCNPGSAPTSSMPFVVALAVRKLGIAPAEAVEACTTKAAQLLGLADRGVVREGARADLVLLRHRDERALAHEFGGDPADLVLCAGEVVKRR